MSPMPDDSGQKIFYKNRYTILRGIQAEGSMRRTDLARKYGVRKSSITTLARELVNEQILCGNDPQKPKSPLVFTEGKWFAAVATIQLDEIVFARIDLSGKVYDRYAIDLNKKSYEELEKKLDEGLEQMVGAWVSACLAPALSIPRMASASTQ